MQTPKVSVVVCTYNQEKTIARTLDSILNQKGSCPYEIILGEDGSTDGTRNICIEYAKKYHSIITLLPAAPNKGMMRNWRDCLAECRGEYIMACAGDDWWHNPDKITIQVDFMDNNPDYVMCYTAIIRHNTKMGTSCKLPVVNRPDMFGALLKVDFISAPTACFRHSMLKVISIDDYIEKGYLMEDYPAWLEMANYGKFKGLSDYTVTYVQNSDSLSTFATLEKQVFFEENVQRVRCDMVQKYHKENMYPPSALQDIFYRNLYSHGIKFNNRKFSLRNILKVKSKSFRDYLKIIFASNAITYSILRWRNKEYASV